VDEDDWVEDIDDCAAGWVGVAELLSWANAGTANTTASNKAKMVRFFISTSSKWGAESAPGALRRYLVMASFSSTNRKTFASLRRQQPTQWLPQKTSSEKPPGSRA
jgi:hypothetical protein